MQSTVSSFIQKITEKTGTEISPNTIWTIFDEEFINRNSPIDLIKVHTELFENGLVKSHLEVDFEGQNALSSTGNGPIDASKKAQIQSSQTWSLSHIQNIHLVRDLIQKQFVI